MRISYTHNLAIMLEEMSRRDDGVGKCMQVVLYQTLADRLWMPFKAVCFNPFITLCVVIVLYLLFCIIYAPLWLASLFVGFYGSLVLFMLFINYLANLISRKIAFAGSNISVQKQISSEFFKRISGFLEMVAVLISDFTAILLLGASGQIPFHEMPNLDGKLREVVEKSSGLSNLAHHFRMATNFLQSYLMTTPVESAQLTQLCNAVEEQVSALSALQPLASSYIIALETCRRSNNAMLLKNARKGGQGTAVSLQPVPRGSPELFKTASHCLKISKALKVAVETTRPVVEIDDDGGILSKVKGLLNFNESLEGGEKVTFPYMRSLLAKRFNVEPFSLQGADKNTIDGVVFPASVLATTGLGDAGASAQTQPPASPATPQPSPVGLVMFCSPNAGFYEGMCQCDLATSWLGYYLQMGYDVCMFNYRGYGLSTGSPNPHSIKEDALLVYQYLQRERRPFRIILHGESIGGMVACHLARRVPVDALVCDRTFATLDATAARLMGRWAGLGLKYCTLWSTNVVRDYLACTCPKIVLQDPNDEIIANLASLKNGVAMRLVMGDLGWKIMSESWEYAYATYEKAELPHKDQEAAMLEEAADVSKRLSERFVAHFYACLADLAKRASALSSRRQTRKKSHPKFSDHVASAATPVRSLRTQHSEHDIQVSIPAGSAELSRRGSGGSSATKDAALEEGYSSSHSSRRDSKDLSAEDGEGFDDAEDAAQAGYESDASARDAILDVLGGLQSTSNDTWSTVEQEGEDIEGGVTRKYSGVEVRSPSGLGIHGHSPMSRREWLEQFCSTPMRDETSHFSSLEGNKDVPNSGRTHPPHSPVQVRNGITKAWAAIGRIDGGSGQLLGQALSGSLEGVRAWICSWLVWAPNAAKDLSLPSGCSDMAGGLKDLRLLTEELHKTELQGDRVVQFLKNALVSLIQRSDAQIFHKPPLGVMLQGSMSYQPHDAVARCCAAYNSAEETESTHGLVGAVEGVAAEGVSVRQQTPTEQVLVRAGAAVATCFWVTQRFLSSNPYASLDVCGDLGDCRVQVGGSVLREWHSTPAHIGQVASGLTTECTCTATTMLSGGEVFTAANTPSPQHMPYIGSLIALHSGHNGWPAQSEVAALTDFFAKSSLA